MIYKGGPHCSMPYAAALCDIAGHLGRPVSHAYHLNWKDLPIIRALEI